MQLTFLATFYLSKHIFFILNGGIDLTTSGPAYKYMPAHNPSQVQKTYNNFFQRENVRDPTMRIRRVGHRTDRFGPVLPDGWGKPSEQQKNKQREEIFTDLLPVLGD